MENYLKEIHNKQNISILCVAYSLAEDVTKGMTEVMLNILDEDIYLREDAAKSMEVIMKEQGVFPTEIREYLEEVLPPEPPRPPSPRLVAELERLKAEDDAREAAKAKKALEGSSDSGEDYVDDGGASKITVILKTCVIYILLLLRKI